MADSAVRSLVLRVTYDDQASAASRSFHAAEKGRIKSTADEQAKADKAYVQAMRQKLAAEKQLDRQKDRAAGESRREQEQAEQSYLKSVRAKLRAEDQLERDKSRAIRQAQREQDTSDRAYIKAVKERLRAEKQLEQERQADVRQSESEVANLIKTYAGISAIRGLAQAVGNEFKRANEYVEKVALQFADVRSAMIQVAALRDKKPTDQFTMEQVKQGARAGLTPKQWAKAQEDFLNPAGAQIGDGPGTKMTDEQAQEYERRVASLTASKLGPENAGLGMSFAGSILEQSKDRLTPGQAMAKFNPAFEVLQKGSIDLRRAMPMMREIQAHGVDATEAAIMLNVAGPAAPGEEATATEASMRAIEKMRVDGSGQQFGVTDKQTKYQAVKAFSHNIAEREASLRKQGKTDEEIEVEIARQLKEADAASDIRERRGLVRGMARQGVTLGGFERYEAIAAKVGPDYDLEAVRGYEGSAEGQANRRRVTKEVALAQSGKEKQPVQAVLEDADNEAIREKAYDRGRADFVYRGAVGMATGVSAEDQVRNEIAVGTLRRKAFYSHGITKDDQAHFQRDEETGVSVKDVQYRSQQSVNDEIRDLLKMLVKAEEQKAQQRNRPQAMPQAAPPLVRGGVR